MYLRGQDGQRGYAMAALLVSIGVMMLLMSVAMPVWRHQAQREKEAELVFRGEQYARAVNHYQRKMGPGNFPQSIDVLVQQRFLRKKYKDPMTEDGEFDIIPVGAAIQPGQNPQPQPGGATPRGGNPSQGRSQLGRPGSQVGMTAPFGTGQPGSQIGSPFSTGQSAAGIMGVRSKSKETAIRIYKGGGTHYNEWNFIFANVSNRPGGPGGRGAPAGGGPGIGPGRRGQGPGGRGPGRGPVGSFPGMPIRRGGGG
jgi:type II secretory pathway pseudopilin PulG